MKKTVWLPKKHERERERESVYEEISNVPGTLENSLST